jgi:APA family basic amino acid/polyamine antiporter
MLYVLCRFLYAMAEDGLMPKLFSELDDKGNLSKGIMVSGAVCVLLALLVPFSYLDDMIRFLVLRECHQSQRLNLLV